MKEEGSEGEEEGLEERSGRECGLTQFHVTCHSPTNLTLNLAL